MKALLFAVVFLGALPARAHEQAEEQARQHFVRARGHHSAGEYSAAIVEYQAAYTLAPLPELLFNLGQCYRLAGRAPEAVLYYRRYLEVVPVGGVAEDARAHILALESPTRQPLGRLPVLPDTGRPFPWRWVSLGVAGTGLVMVGVGGVFAARAASAATRLEEARGPFTADLQELDDSRRGDVKRMWIVGGLGAAALTTGVVLFLWKGTSEPRVAARPVVGAGGAGISLSGAF